MPVDLKEQHLSSSPGSILVRTRSCPTTWCTDGRGRKADVDEEFTSIASELRMVRSSKQVDVVRCQIE
jgi:hypothetical protein